MVLTRPTCYVVIKLLCRLRSNVNETTVGSRIIIICIEWKINLFPSREREQCVDLCNLFYVNYKLIIYWKVIKFNAQSSYFFFTLASFWLQVYFRASNHKCPQKS